MQTLKTYRQGDVLIKEIKQLPNNLIKSKDNLKNKIVLAYGEVTGHCHRFENIKDVELLESKDVQETRRFLNIKATSELKHEEHSTLTFNPGIYEVIQQKEYSMGQIKRVLD